MTIKYKYTAIPTSTDSKGKFTRRPILKIFFPGTNISALGLLDSGADMTMLNIAYAKLLSIDLDKSNQKNFRGIADGYVSCYIKEINLEIEHFKDRVIVVPVAFIDSENVDVLIGQEGIFDNFKIKFEKDHEIFELSEVKR